MYKRAFQCSNCPKSNDSDGCPFWWEIVKTNEVTGEVRVDKACGIVQLPLLVVQSIASAHAAVKQAADTRNEVAAIAANVVQSLEHLNGMGQELTNVLDKLRSKIVPVPVELQSNASDPADTVGKSDTRHVSAVRETVGPIGGHRSAGDNARNARPDVHRHCE